MQLETKQTIAVVGATGLQGQMVCEKLLEAGHVVIGVTRDPQSSKAQQLAAKGVQLASCDLNQADQLALNCPPVDALFVALDSMHKDPETEFNQGMNAFRCAQTMGVAHLVYSSVGYPSANNKVAHFAVKNRLEQQLKATGLAWTILRPTAFMEGLVEKKFVPPVLWHVWSRSTGWDTPIQWVAVEDIANAALAAFSQPEQTKGQIYTLVGDRLSLRQAQQVFKGRDGKAPSRIPMPVWLFRKLVSEDLYNLFCWYKNEGFNADPEEIHRLVPKPLDFPTWLTKRRATHG